jgi:hypothetical protein
MDSRRGFAVTERRRCRDLLERRCIVATSKLVKIVVLVLLLIPAGAFFGMACQNINQQYELLLLLDKEVVRSFAQLLLAVAAVAVIGGLLAALVRPIWICIVGFALSALAAFLAWELSLPSGVSALIYFVFGALYSRAVAEALDNRLKFSVEPILGGQSTLLTGLAIAASVSLYFGYAAQIEEQGFELPPAIGDAITEFSMVPMRAQIEARMDLTSEQKEALAAQMREGFDQWMASMEETIQPYERLVPVAVAFMLLQLLAVINTLFSWVPIVFLAVLFPILTAVGVVKKTTETMEVERLSLGYLE